MKTISTLNGWLKSLNKKKPSSPDPGNMYGKLRNINFKQAKYIIPVILYLGGYLIMYLFREVFITEPIEVKSAMETTEYLNSNLPQASATGDIGGKYDNMVKSYGKIQDYSAVENIDRDSDVEVKEDYTSKYTDYDLEFLDGTAANNANNAPISASASPKNQGNATVTPADTRTPQQRQAEAIAELEKVIAASRNKNTAGSEDTRPRTPSTPRRSDRATLNEREIRIDDRPTATEVVKKVRANSDYFNTIADGVPESNLIKAIIDENISAVDGSRIRLRLLDDIVINDVVIPGGTCLYASMNGFGSQRVKGSVTSIMVEGVPVTVNLSIYDTDGLEGLYVPSSSFRDTTKDIASGALGGNMSINTTSTGNSLSQWGMQAVQNAYQQTASAISKAVKKNRAKIKYGSFVYLVNAKDKTKQ